MICREQRLEIEADKEKCPAPLQWQGQLYVRLESSEFPTPTETRPNRRRRTRTANRKMAAIAGEELEYLIDSNLALLEFQMTIMDDFEISPLNQLLYIVGDDKDERLLNFDAEAQNKTLGELQVKNEQVLILRRKDEGEDGDDGVSAVNGQEVDENNRKNRGQRAEGFGGTLLSVLANAASTKRQSTRANDEYESLDETKD